jgi:hypothetical protein
MVEEIEDRRRPRPGRPIQAITATYYLVQSSSEDLLVHDSMIAAGGGRSAGFSHA